MHSFLDSCRTSAFPFIRRIEPRNELLEFGTWSFGADSSNAERVLDFTVHLWIIPASHS
jgi:hypothetical protein